MRLATVRVHDRVALALVEGDGTVRDLTAVLGTTSMLDLIDRWADLGPVISRAGDLPEITPSRFMAPIPEPRRDLFAVGKNYRAHVAEFGRSGFDRPDRSEAVPEWPVVFSKATTAVTGPYDTIEAHPAVTTELDYEAELAVVIGRRARAVSRRDAMDQVWGYTVINDVTARDLQRRHQQWLLGKSLDTHAPMGPWVVTADEVPDVRALRVSSRVNGRPRQDASVADLIFSVPELIETISAGTTLLPGDIIATGTPAGVGIGFDPPVFLRPGDVVECAVEGVGGIRNVVR